MSKYMGVARQIISTRESPDRKRIRATIHQSSISCRRGDWVIIYSSEAEARVRDQPQLEKR